MSDDTRTSSVCDKCPAHCCSNRFGYTSIRLTYEERQHPLLAPHLTADGLLKLEGRHCRFLDPKAARCTIYEDRPHACRGFVCHDTVNQGDDTLAMVYRNKALKELLEREGKLPPLTKDLFWAENPNRTPTGVMYSSFMYRHRAFSAGTWRFFKLEAATGKIILEGRRRSTKVPFTPQKYRKVWRDLEAMCAAADVGVELEVEITETKLSA